MKKNFIFLTETESTNNYANQLLMSKAAEEGTVVMSQFQTKGKGQQGNTWESEPEMNLLASFILQPKFLKAGDQFYLSKVVSLAISDFLAEEKIMARIKWPNDIYVENKKIAGILIENSIVGMNLFSSIAGIGFNINQIEFKSDAPNPVSLKQITGLEFKVENIANRIWEKLEFRYEQLKSGNFEAINTSYINLLYRYNLWAFYATKNRVFEAKITGTGPFGQLVLEDRDGLKTEHLFKEVEFIL